MFACVTGFGILKKFFESQALRYLGFISFSMYLLHVIVLEVIERVSTEMSGKGWVMLMLTVLVSHISWTFIEKPTSKIRLVEKTQKATSS